MFYVVVYECVSWARDSLYFSPNVWTFPACPNGKFDQRTKIPHSALPVGQNPFYDGFIYRPNRTERQNLTSTCRWNSGTIESIPNGPITIHFRATLSRIFPSAPQHPLYAHKISITLLLGVSWKAQSVQKRNPKCDGLGEQQGSSFPSINFACDDLAAIYFNYVCVIVQWTISSPKNIVQNGLNFLFGVNIWEMNLEHSTAASRFYKQTSVELWRIGERLVLYLVVVNKIITSSCLRHKLFLYIHLKSSLTKREATLFINFNNYPAFLIFYISL